MRTEVTDATRVEVAMTLGELRSVVGLLNLAAESLPAEEVPGVVGDISGLYFNLMENLA